MKQTSLRLILGWLALFAITTAVPAASVSLTGSDPVNTTSFNAAGKWSNTSAPSAANDYFTGGYFMRTPGVAGNYTFAGHSLTLQQPTIAGVRSIIFKGGNNDVLTINNFTNAFGGILENGGSGAATVTYTGDFYTIAGNSAVVANQGPMIIGHALIGAEGVILTNAGGNATGIAYTGDLSGFKGKFYLSTINFGNGGGATTVALNGANSLPGNPSTTTPDQFRLEAGCTLLDNVGLTFNNANGGITLAGNATINAAATTTMTESIIDLTNGVSSVSSLTKAGAGTLTLNASNNYSGGTIVSAGILQLANARALPAGNVTADGTLDLNGFSNTIGGLNGAGYVDTLAAGTPTLTIGTNNASGTFSGVIQNSAGTLSLTKIGTGTQTLSGGYSYSGKTIVAGGRLIVVVGASPGTPGDTIVTNGAVLAVDTTLGGTLAAQNVVIGPNGALDLTPNSAATGLSVAGNLTLQNNATNSFQFGALTANPSVAPINVTGSVSTPGTGIVLQIDGSGFQSGMFTLIDYTGTALANLNNFTLITPPSVSATLINNTANTSIDVNISFVTKNVSWYGAVGTGWDFATYNWRTNGVDTFYQQYTNGSLIVGDGARFDDTLYNDFVNPQPTNINLTATFYPFPLVVDSTLPYSFSGVGSLAGTAALVKSNTGSLILNTANSYAGGTYIYGGSVVVNNDSALGAAGMGVTLSGGNLAFGTSTTSARPVTMAAGSSISVVAGATAQLTGTIAGSGGLTKTDTGTLTLTGSNALTGALSVNAGTLNISSGTATFAGSPSYVAYQTGTATLNLGGSATLSAAGDLRVGGSDVNGTGYDANGTFNMSGGTANLSALTIARGNNNQNSCAGEVNLSGGTMTVTNDVLLGFAGTGKGTLRISGTGILNVGTTTKWLRLGQWDTTSGEIQITGGNLNLNQGSSIKINQNNSTGPKTFTQDGGAVTFYSDFATTIGGGGDLDLMLTGTATATNTYNLNGGTLTVPWVRSSGSTGTRIFNFNGGTLRATRANSTFLSLGSGNAIANVRNGGAVIDDAGFNIAIGQALMHSTIAGDNTTDGGLTKNGTGSLALSGANTFNGPITVNAGSLLLTTASSLQGNLTISDHATLSIAQVGSATKTTGNVTFNGGAGTPGATLGLAVTAANNPTSPLINCGTLTLNGTNTISLAGAVNVGTIALIQYNGSIAGSGNCTNLLLPQGAIGYISNYVAGSTIYAVVTSTGPGLVWTGGTNNLWDIKVSTNWLLNALVTTYQQTIIPGDAVTFNDTGSGTVIVNANVGPTSLTISNNSKAYTFSGTGSIAGPAGVLKVGTGTAVLNLTNNTYSGDTIINGGSLQFGVASGMPASGNLVVGTNGTLQIAGVSLTVKELTGSGVVNNGGGLETLLTLGSSSGGTWNGTVTNSAGGVALRKGGTGTWVVGGPNYFDNGQSFSFQNQINQGTVIITNGGLINSDYLQMQIANGAGQTGVVVVAGGTLRVTNNVLSIGYGADSANGTLIVNSGTVDHSGLAAGTFASVANSIDVGAQGATGTLIVNGGEVLNDQPLFLGDGATASGTLYLNGGLVRASVVQPNGTPVASIAYFNGGTLQAATNSTDFIQSTAMVQANGLVLDDGGFEITLASQGLLEDVTSPGGGLLKTGAGTVYLDAASTYTGTTVINNGTLAGVSSISGPVVVAPTGNIGGGNAAGIGTLYLNTQPLTIQGKATMRINKNGGVPTSDLITGISTANYGGTLVITNTTSDATPLVLGDTFTLFNATTPAGNFTSIVGSPGTGLAYSFNPASGVLSVTAEPTYPPEPPPITFGISSGWLQLSWPSAYLGYLVQAQTNSLNVGIVPGDSSWYTITGSGASTTYNIPISSANPAVFYRLHKP